MKKNQGSFICCLAGLLASSIFLSCSAPVSMVSPLNYALPCHSSKPGPLSPRLNKAFGDLTLVEREQRFRLKIALQRNSEGYLVADIFTPFGSSVAMLSTDSTGGWIEAPQQRYQFANDDPIATISHFSHFPFTFGEFVQIITGDYSFFKDFLGQPDSTIVVHQTTRFKWQRSDFSATATVNNVSGELSFLKAQTAAQEPWEVSFARFRDGIPREIIYKVDEANYFILTWDKIVSSQTVSTSLLWQPQ